MVRGEESAGGKASSVRSRYFWIARQGVRDPLEG
jgi:hypothetical protein